ncbi:type II toxin-antitoxin system VapB family antitoxin [Haloferula sargassicola]|uniref:DUF2191 domain-containing protein n=1 Tax=Haloferula sargassicola TaxID=490096 RepID=A0ABP9UQJ7_9BACT
MRITVSLDDSEISEVQEITGETQKSKAVAKAVGAFIRQSRAVRFTERAAAGEFDGWFDWQTFEDAERVSLEDAKQMQERFDDRGDR